MTDKMIRRFSESGSAKDSKLIQTRDTIHKVMVDQMKDEGFALLLDLDPVWKMSWVKEDIYSFTYTLQGVYVGKDVSWQTEGILNGKRLPITAKNKSNQS